MSTPGIKRPTGGLNQKPSEPKATAERSLKHNGLKLPYRDLASEVTRRRFTMASREEAFTKKPEEEAMLFNLDLDQLPPPGMADPPVPPAPPPSPAEDPQVS